jgi:hypothetical protein
MRSAHGLDGPLAAGAVMTLLAVGCGTHAAGTETSASAAGACARDPEVLAGPQVACDDSHMTGTTTSALRGEGCFDPVDYGAVPWTTEPLPDAPDSRPGIQAAIDDACASGGGRVCLRDGRWRISRAPAGSYNRFAGISWHCSGVHLTGNGPDTVIAMAGDAGAATFFGIALDPGASDSVIRDLTIDSTELFNTDLGEQTHAIVVGTNVCAGATCEMPIANTTIQRVGFRHDGQPGERWGDCIRVAGNTPATQAFNTKLLDLDFTMCGRSGVAIQRNANALTISRSFFAADLIGGTPVDGEATGGEWDDGLIVSHNQIWKFLPGGDTYMISLTSQRHFSIDHNLLRGVLLGGRGCISAVRISDGTIDHNECSANDAVETTSMIDLANLADNVVVSGNVLRRSGGAGQCIKSQPHSGIGATGLSIKGNTCINDTDGAAIMLAAVKDTTVSGNILRGNGGPSSMGIYVFPTDAHVENLGVNDNRVRGMAHSAIRLGATDGFGFTATTVALNTSAASGPFRCENPQLIPPGGIVAGLNNWSTPATCAPP